MSKFQGLSAGKMLQPPVVAAPPFPLAPPVVAAPPFPLAPPVVAAPPFPETPPVVTAPPFPLAPPFCPAPPFPETPPVPPPELPLEHPSRSILKVQPRTIPPCFAMLIPLVRSFSPRRAPPPA